MPFICLSLVIVSLMISAVLCAALMGASGPMGLVDSAGTQAHKPVGRVIPNTGGIAIFLAVAGPMAMGLLAVWLMPLDWWTTPSQSVPGGQALMVQLPGLRQTAAIGGGVLVAMALLHLMGLADDRRPLGPFVKLVIELVIAAFLVLLCDIRVLHFLDHHGWWGQAISALVSVAWIVVIINAMNFLDNMDGLTAGVTATIAVIYLGATLIGGQWFVAAMAALLLGAVLGFLLFNFPPARLIMGDGGSLVIGLLLAVISVRTTYFAGSMPLGQVGDVPAVSPGLGPGQWYAVLMPLMVMAIPLYDFVSVTAIRFMHGASPFRGDLNHFSHRLVRKGLSKQRAVILIWMCTLATGLGGVMLGSLSWWQAVLAAAQTLAILAVLAIVERGRTLGDPVAPPSP